jgi:hypothetical protein
MTRSGGMSPMISAWLTPELVLLVVSSAIATDTASHKGPVCDFGRCGARLGRLNGGCRRSSARPRPSSIHPGMKGKAEPAHLWRAVRVLAGMGGSQRVDGLEAPLTWRDHELRTVRELFHAAAERRVPRLVLVSGPAGVGKSRLGWEFRKYTDGLAGTIWWHRGRCLSCGDGVAFWALAEMVRQRLGIAEEDSVDVTAGKLAQWLDRFVPDLGEQSYIGSRLGRLLGVSATGDSGAAVSREELFAGWRLFFQRLAEVHPVVLVVEDGQYADAGLLGRRGRPHQRRLGRGGRAGRAGRGCVPAGRRDPGGRPRPGGRCACGAGTPRRASS